MIRHSEKALLPAGMSDRLPPEADREEDCSAAILERFRRYGYRRVKPPLLEFEDNLISGNGRGLSKQTFRLMDPASQRMMGLRADATTQIARIATTRLTKQPRPLRLSYNAEVLRVSGSQLRPERQFRQVGAELIGTVAPNGDVEVILMALDALTALGIVGISVDIAAPTFVSLLADGLELSADVVEPLKDALDRKDDAEVRMITRDLPQNARDIFNALLATVGPADRGIEKLKGLDIPKAAQPLLGDLSAVIEGVASGCRGDVTITFDPVDNRGFEYHAGVTFTLFAQGVRGELGKGGRYHTEPDENEHWEACTGLTIFMDSVLRAMPKGEEDVTLLADANTPLETIQRLRDEGWVVLQTLDFVTNLKEEAERLGCSHFLDSDKPTRLA